MQLNIFFIWFMWYTLWCFETAGFIKYFHNNFIAHLLLCIQNCPDCSFSCNRNQIHLYECFTNLEALILISCLESSSSFIQCVMFPIDYDKYSFRPIHHLSFILDQTPQNSTYLITDFVTGFLSHMSLKSTTNHIDSSESLAQI